MAVAVLTATALSALPAAASAATKAVTAGPPPAAKQLAGKLLGKQFLKQNSPDINDFFLHRVTVNAGDTVSFQIDGFHTVDIPASGGGDLPFVLPNGSTATGVNDAAGNPFWFNGKVPNIGPNPAVAVPSGSTTYDGSARVDSGLPLGPPKPLNVTFTNPGTYKYFCDVHPGMIGFVVVKPAGAQVPSAAQDAKAAHKQLKADILEAKKLAGPKLKADHVSVGSAGKHGVELFAMFPSKLSVKRGTVVTFAMSKRSRELHTATFGPKPYLKALANGFQGPVFPAAGANPSSPKQPIPLSPKSHGNGFANTGAIDTDSDTPNVPLSGKIKFVKAGVYHYICLIHPNMRGTIVVTK